MQQNVVAIGMAMCRAEAVSELKLRVTSAKQYH